VQSIDAAHGKQFTGPDGEFDAEHVWPYSEPVQVQVYSHDPGKYASYVATSERFVVEPKGRYRFDMVLPFTRNLVLKVTDPEGNPLDRVRVRAMWPNRGIWSEVYQMPGVEPMVTDGNGLVTIQGLAPNGDCAIFLYRLPEGESDYQKASATAWSVVKVPAERQPGRTQVTFDARPIRIEGSMDVPAGADGWVELWVSDAKAGAETSIIQKETADDGRFVLEGVPAGTVSVRLFTIVPDKKMMLEATGNSSSVLGSWLPPDKKMMLEATGNVGTEPGHAYFVQVVENRVELARVEKIE
jgi:hypothetical protein